MIAALLLAASFRAAFPSATVVRAPGSETIASASDFTAKGLGDTPGKAARAFLERYGDEFGVVQALVVRSEPPAQRAGVVRFERRIGGLPVFDADIALGVDASGSVVLVNAAPCPRKVQGKAKISRAAAIRAARASIRGLESVDEVRAVRGFKPLVDAVRPVWRVELVARRPPGDFRIDVDAATGRVISKANLRMDAIPSRPVLR